MPVRASIEPLAWESEFFDLPSAILRINETAEPLSEARLAGWARLQAKIPAARADWLDALQQLGFKLVEGEIDLSLRVGRHAATSAEVATQADIPLLRQQAAAAFAQSRFRAPWYAEEDSGRFYARWIENAVKGLFDHQCLVLRSDDGDIRGFVSLRQLSGEEARIGLLAGRGAGAELMQAALGWAQARQLTTLRVATQTGNTAALKRYIQSGANVESAAYWLYR